MTTNVRKKILSRAKKLVIKIGTGVLTSDRGLLDREMIKRITEQVHQLKLCGIKVVIVSSGAIGAGMGELGLEKRPDSLPELQAAAAVGQGKLISAYDDFFKLYGYHTAQILLTREDFNDRLRYLNASNTIRSLWDLDAIPIINENDTISVRELTARSENSTKRKSIAEANFSARNEITFGDNDCLSALVTNLVRADILIMLSVVDGLYANYDSLTAIPVRSKPHSEASGVSLADRGRQVVELVEEVTDDVKKLASDDRSERGIGGMESKLLAAWIATSSGEAAIIANGREENVLLRIMDAEPIGTFFLPARSKMASRKRWIGFTAQPRGEIIVDRGAKNALQFRGKSLLASGVINVEGRFKKGDVVRLSDAEKSCFARGLSNYSSEEVLKIKGLRSISIHKVLGYKPYDEVVHRDNMVLL